MKISLSSLKYIVLIGAVATGVRSASAGVPLNTIQGEGGVAFNPLAYTAGQNKDPKDPAPGADFISKPQFGIWQVHLGDVNVDWTAIGGGFTLFDRIELSYSHEIAAPAAKNIYKSNFGAKVNLVPENAGDNKFVPAVSAGVLVKKTSDTAKGVNDSGQDYYLVATKLITQTPLPILVSGGALSTDSRVTGVFGYDDKRDIAGFGNLDVLPLANVAVGFEYEQGAKFDDFKNADYWDAHIAWFANKSLTLVAAYTDTGDSKSKSAVGLGNGYVLSAQYAF